MGMVGNMENSMYLIAVDECVRDLVNSVKNPLLENIIEHFYIIEYNTDTKYYKIIKLSNEDVVFFANKEKLCFDYMDMIEINFIGDDNPLGRVFYSYASTYLELIRWTADVYYTKRYLLQLIQE